MCLKCFDTTLLQIRNCTSENAKPELESQHFGRARCLGDLCPYREGPPNAYGARISRGDRSVTAGVEKIPHLRPPFRGGQLRNGTGPAGDLIHILRFTSSSPSFFSKSGRVEIRDHSELPRCGQASNSCLKSFQMAWMLQEI